MKRVSTWLAVISVTCCMVVEVHAQEGFRAWVGLYEPAELGWLENENRLGELCTDSSTLAECYERNLGSKGSLHELRDGKLQLVDYNP